MKISKKEKVLLLIMFLLVIGASYFFFFYRHHGENIQNLEAELSDAQTEYDLMQAKIIASNGVDERIEEYTQKIKDISAKNYGLLRQENQTILIKRLARGTGLKINSINYSYSTESLASLEEQYKSKLLAQIEMERMSGEDLQALSQISLNDGTTRSEEENTYLQTSLVDVLTASISFEGGFLDINEYLKNIYEYNKNIIINQLAFNSDNPESQSGTLTISFYGVRELKHFVDLDKVFKSTSNRGKDENAFIPYKTYVDVAAKIKEEDETNKIKDQVKDVDKDDYKYVPIPSDDDKKDDKKDDTEEKDNPIDPNAKTLESFETFDVFFVGDNEVEGDVTPSTLASKGKKSIKLSFNFKNPELKNRANIVFDKQKKIIYSKAANVGISLYTNKPLGENRLGFVIVDSTGKEYEMYFDIDKAAKDWIYANSSLNDALVYPCMIQRIFVEGEGMNQTLKGNVFIDDLRYSVTTSQ